MNYKEQRAFEATLTTAQRRKIRTMESLHEETLTPIRNAHWARYEQVKREAFASLKCAERVQEIRNEIKPTLDAIKEQIRELQEQQTRILDEARVKEEAISAEAYDLAGNDPQVLATGAIWQGMKEAHAKKKEELFASLQK